MKCDNYKGSGICKYYGTLIGTIEDPPTGMNSATGECNPAFWKQWEDMEDEDCNMLTLVEVKEND